MKKEIPPENLIKLATDRMYSSMNAFFMWKWLNHAINVNKAGADAANENVEEVMNKYRFFFHQVMKDSFKCFVLDLGVFFDKNYDNSFSLTKLIEVLKHKLSKEDLEKIEKIKRDNASAISQLIDLRTQEVAHQAVDPKKQYVNYEMFENLFKGLHEIIDLLSMTHDNSMHWWDHVEMDIDRDMEWVFENLKRGEKQRIKEIEDEFQASIDSEKSV